MKGGGDARGMLRHERLWRTTSVQQEKRGPQEVIVLTSKPGRFPKA